MSTTYESICLEYIQSLPDDYPNRQKMIDHWEREVKKPRKFELPRPYVVKLRRQLEKKINKMLEDYYG